MSHLFPMLIAAAATVGCGKDENSSAKGSGSGDPLSPEDTLEATAMGMERVCRSLEALVDASGLHLDSRFEGDWPQSGTGTVSYDDTIVDLVFTVDRSHMDRPHRRWTLEATLDPLVQDGVTLTGDLRGVWELDGDTVETTTHEFDGEVVAEDGLKGTQSVVYDAVFVDAELSGLDGTLGGEAVVVGDAPGSDDR